MKQIVIITPYYGIYPPENGGMQRCFYMLTELVKYFDVTLIMYQDSASFSKSFEKFPLLRNLKLVSIHEVYEEPKDIFSYLPKSVRMSLRYRWLRKKIIESASSTYLHLRPILKNILRDGSIDTVLIENSSDIILSSYIRKLSPKTRIIYEAHNVDSDLAYKDYKLGKLKYKHYKKVLSFESTLHKTCDGVVCMSSDDREILNRLNNGKVPFKINTTTIPLPKRLANNGALEPGNRKIMYCGSLDYYPNYEGLSWFYANVWPFLKKNIDLELIVVGSGKPDKSLEPLKHDSCIKLVGRVPDVWDYYNMASVVIVPLLSGSGIRLKILEAMAMGVPIVSTSKGAEGITYTRNHDILINDQPEGFALDVVSLIHDVEKRKTLAANARSLMETKYNWEQTGRELKDFIEKI
jgi:Glycosyltransferase